MRKRKKRCSTKGCVGCEGKWGHTVCLCGFTFKGFGKSPEHKCLGDIGLADFFKALGRGSDA